MVEKTSPQSVAIIVVNSEQAAMLNGSGALNENSRAFAYGMSVVGARFDAVLVLDRAIYREERDWFENVIATRLKPGGLISHVTP